jgi:YVTN family beta-propeller protein
MKVGKHCFGLLALLSACHSSPRATLSPGPSQAAANAPSTADASRNGPDSSAAGAGLPLALVADVDLPGRAVRFDYQDLDLAMRHLVIAHMSDASVVVVNLSDGAPVGVIPNVPTARAVVVADDVGRIFVTSSPNQLVIIDNGTLTEVARVQTGSAPDGVGWDPTHRVVGVSDQGDGAISLLADSGLGARQQLLLGSETGNVVFDAGRQVFWITVVAKSPPDQLVAVDPVGAQVMQSLSLPGCSGAHGLRIHPDGKSAFIACEDNDVLARVALDGVHAVTTGPTGSGPDVLSIDPGLGWLYVAAESGDLTVFDITQPGVALLGHDQPGDNSHSVAADPATHRVFFPLLSGPNGTPVLRILRPTGIAPNP